MDRKESDSEGRREHENVMCCFCICRASASAPDHACVSAVCREKEDGLDGGYRR